MTRQANVDPRTAEELVTALEGLPLEQLGDLDGTMAGLTRSRLALTHMIDAHEAARLRCLRLLLRVQRLIGVMEKTHPGRWARSAGGKAPNGAPADRNLPQE